MHPRKTGTRSLEMRENLEVTMKMVKSLLLGSAAGILVVAGAQAAGSWNHLAQALGVKVIHISERDTQISSVPKQEDEFVNTWSVEGFYEEGIAPAEMGWGTHERSLPARNVRCARSLERPS